MIVEKLQQAQLVGRDVDLLVVDDVEVVGLELLTRSPPVGLGAVPVALALVGLALVLRRRVA